LLLKTEIKPGVVPKFAEFLVQDLYSMVADRPETHKYLPDKPNHNKKQPHRTFVYDVINSVHPDFI
jgi:hypothetical protein